ncbi:MAG: hypothetical protein J5671_08105 [Bacteroidaceae bacterium]|nr:hypothetical protein [Bacteroidaceae bacterium]
MEVAKIIYVSLFICLLASCKNNVSLPSDVKENSSIQKDFKRTPPELKVLNDGRIVPMEGKGISKKDFNRLIVGHGWIEIMNNPIKSNGSKAISITSMDRNGLFVGDKDPEKLYFSKDSVMIFAHIGSGLYHWNVPFTLSTEWNTRSWTYVRKEVYSDSKRPTKFIVTEFMTILSYHIGNDEFIALRRLRMQRKEGDADSISYENTSEYNLIWFRRMTEKEQEESKQKYHLAREEYEKKRYGI